MIDKMSGNPVPPGAMPKEVRDDIAINASEGEYILPADVVRYLGLDKIEKMVKSAKEGIQGMGEQGRIGGEPPMPAPTPQGAPMFNVGGLVTNTTNPSRGELTGVSEYDANIPFAFNPAPYLGGFDPNGHIKIFQYRGPNGEMMYIPTNNNGQPLFSPPEGYTQVGAPVDAPVEQAPQVTQENSEKSPTWTEGLTPAEVKQERENRTFRTRDQIDRDLNPQSGGSFGDAIRGMVDSIGGVFSKLTSGEMFGGIVQALATVGVGGPVGMLVGNMIDRYNDQRVKEGKPPLATEEVVVEASQTAGIPITVQDLNDVANATVTSPTKFKTQTLPDDTQSALGRSPIGFGQQGSTPQSPTGDSVGDKATQRGVLKAEGYTVIGEMGTANNLRYMVIDPEGKVTTVKPGDEIGGATFRGIREGIADPVGSALREVGIFDGALKEPPAGMPRGAMDPRESALGRNPIGLPNTSRSGTPLPTPSSASSSGIVQRPAAGLGSADIAFSGGTANSPSEDSGSSTSGVGRTGTGAGSVSGAFSSQYGSTSPGSQSSIGYSMGTSVSPSDPRPSAGYSLGTSVSNDSRDTRNSGFSSDQQSGRAPAFNKGGLVGPVKSTLLQSYNKGGLVKRKK